MELPGSGVGLINIMLQLGLRAAEAVPVPSGMVSGVAGNAVKRSSRCGECAGCRGDDCGQCANCHDKPKFGGQGARSSRARHAGCRTIACTSLRVCMLLT